jgi:hypothetical protein
METKNKQYVILLFFILICARTYSAGVRFAEKYNSNSGIDKYFNGKIISIDSNDDLQYLNSWNSRTIYTSIEYQKSGLIIAENNWGKYIIYNEFFNENILSSFKLNENTTLLTIEKGQEYEIIYNPNSITLVSINSKYGYDLTRILELQFDENSKRLLTSNNKRFNDGVFDYEYSYFFEYEYDSFGKLEHIYKIYNSKKILV